MKKPLSFLSVTGVLLVSCFDEPPERPTLGNDAGGPSATHMTFDVENVTYRVQHSDDSARFTTINAQGISHESGGDRRLKDVNATTFLSANQVLHIQADSGLIHMPDEKAEEAVFAPGCTLKLFQFAENEIPDPENLAALQWQIVFEDEVHFDLIRQELRTGGLVSLQNAGIKMNCKGLRLQMNRETQVLSLLHLEEILFLEADASLFTGSDWMASEHEISSSTETIAQTTEQLNTQTPQDAYTAVLKSTELQPIIVERLDADDQVTMRLETGKLNVGWLLQKNSEQASSAVSNAVNKDVAVDIYEPSAERIRLRSTGTLQLSPANVTSSSWQLTTANNWQPTFERMGGEQAHCNTITVHPDTENVTLEGDVSLVHPDGWRLETTLLQMNQQSHEVMIPTSGTLSQDHAQQLTFENYLHLVINEQHTAFEKITLSGPCEWTRDSGETLRAETWHLNFDAQGNLQEARATGPCLATMQAQDGLDKIAITTNAIHLIFAPPAQDSTPLIKQIEAIGNTTLFYGDSELHGDTMIANCTQTNGATVLTDASCTGDMVRGTYTHENSDAPYQLIATQINMTLEDEQPQWRARGEANNFAQLFQANHMVEAENILFYSATQNASLTGSGAMYFTTANQQDIQLTFEDSAYWFALNEQAECNGKVTARYTHTQQSDTQQISEILAPTGLNIQLESITDDNKNETYVLRRAQAIGNTSASPASISAYLINDSGNTLQRAYLEGPTIVMASRPATNETEAVEAIAIAGPGRMLIEDFRQSDAQQSFSNQGQHAFSWHKHCKFDALAGRIVLSEQVQAAHRPESTDPENPAEVIRMRGQSAEILLSNTLQLSHWQVNTNTASKQTSTGPKLESFVITGAIHFQRGIEHLTCDEMHYNANDNHVIWESAAPRMVTLSKEDSIQAATAQRVIWHLDTEQMVADQGGGITVPFAIPGR